MEYTKIITGYRTDHSAIVFRLSASPANRGKGYWKFNSQLLRDSNYIDIVKTCIRNTLSEYYSVGNIDDFLHVELLCNDQVFFEILKMKIRSVSITYSIRKSRDEKEKTLKLENDIQILENQMNLNPTEFIQASLNQKKGELENQRQDIVEGLLLQSRANWHENGERCSEYFCKLEKKSSINKTISELINENHISEQSKILFEQEQYYRKLYSSNHLCVDNEFFFQHDVKLSDEQKNSLEGNLSFKECGESLKLMKNGKSPGSDGFTVYFYKFFWNDIGALFFGHYILAMKRAISLNFRLKELLLVFLRRVKIGDI